MKLSLAKLCPTIQVAKYLAWENFMCLFFKSSQSCTTILSHIKVGYKTRRLGEGEKVRDECHIIWSNYTQSLTSICLTYECPCICKSVLQGGSAEFSLCCSPPFCLIHRSAFFQSVAGYICLALHCGPCLHPGQGFNTCDPLRSRKENRKFKEKKNINFM